MSFTNKLVAVINQDIPTGIAMNALAHMTVGMATELDYDMLKLDDYEDRDGNIYPNISQMPFIILKGTSDEIKEAVMSAKVEYIKHGVFVNTMTGGTFEEQLENTAKTAQDDLVFYGVVMYGLLDKVNPITKKFSLYR